MLYVSFMVTPKQKFIIDTQHVKRKELNMPVYKIIKSWRKEKRVTCTTAKNTFK